MYSKTELTENNSMNREEYQKALIEWIAKLQKQQESDAVEFHNWVRIVANYDPLKEEKPYKFRKDESQKDIYELYAIFSTENLKERQQNNALGLITKRELELLKALKQMYEYSSLDSKYLAGKLLNDVANCKF